MHGEYDNNWCPLHFFPALLHTFIPSHFLLLGECKKYSSGTPLNCPSSLFPSCDSPPSSLWLSGCEEGREGGREVNGHPLTADTHVDVTDISESPDRFSFHFNASETPE